MYSAVLPGGDNMDNGFRERVGVNTAPPAPARFTSRLIYLCICVVLAQTVLPLSNILGTRYRTTNNLDTKNLAIATRHAALVTKCSEVRKPVGPPLTFASSSRLSNGQGNERWVPGTPPVLVKNARIWTGRDVVEHGNVFIDKGLIVASGELSPSLLHRIQLQNDTEIIDARGRWLTPGLVDIHSHLAVDSAPALQGAFELNSLLNPVQPWARSVDALNTHDDGYRLSIAGGVTTAQILPGSANNIGGQAVVIKLRETKERSTTSRLVEPPESIVLRKGNTSEWVHWRHMKHALGENPDYLYAQTRMDGLWNFRKAYDSARKIMIAQDAFCDKVAQGDWAALALVSDNGTNQASEFPEDLQWESLVDVLRGRVKVSIHSYEAVDLDAIVRLSNEFAFPIASIHHAGEAYIVPDLLKKIWGGPPVVSLFASNFGTKRESYRSSEFAPRVLADHGIPVAMKSDHPIALNSRYLMFEAQQAHYYGLDPFLALASVTSVPAAALGMGHRVGRVAPGYDADLVLWDSHPLALGATPVQVFIDGIEQLPRNAPVLRKEEKSQRLPKVPDFDKERNETVKWQGAMPLRGRMLGRVRVVNVSAVDLVSEGEIDNGHGAIAWESVNKNGVVVIEDGRIVCSSPTASNAHACLSASILDGRSGSDLNDTRSEVIVDLQGGELRFGLTTYGAPIGLVEIRLEPSTNDGGVHDPLLNGDPPALVQKAGMVHAADGLAFEGKNLLLAYRSGVTTGITAPSGPGFQGVSPVPAASGFLQGISTAFSLGAPNALANGAITQMQTALHVTLSYTLPVSVSTQVAVLRKMLFDGDSGGADDAWGRVRRGDMTLVVSVQNADIMATLLSLKDEYERHSRRTLKLTFSGAMEAHLLADEIAAAGVSIVLTKTRPFPFTWEQKRILPGPPLSGKTALIKLLDAGVNTAIGVVDEAEARNTLFELAWASLDSNGTISKATALALASTNLHKALGYVPSKHIIPDIVMYHGGGVLEFGTKVIGIISGARRVVELF